MWSVYHKVFVKMTLTMPLRHTVVIRKIIALGIYRPIHKGCAGHTQDACSIPTQTMLWLLQFLISSSHAASTEQDVGIKK